MSNSLLASCFLSRFVPYQPVPWSHVPSFPVPSRPVLSCLIPSRTFPPLLLHPLLSNHVASRPFLLFPVLPLPVPSRTVNLSNSIQSHAFPYRIERNEFEEKDKTEINRKDAGQDGGRLFERVGTGLCKTGRTQRFVMGRLATGECGI